MGLTGPALPAAELSWPASPAAPLGLVGPGAVLRAVGRLAELSGLAPSTAPASPATPARSLV